MAVVMVRVSRGVLVRISAGVRMAIRPELLAWQVLLAVHHDVQLGGRNTSPIHA